MIFDRVFIIFKNNFLRNLSIFDYLNFFRGIIRDGEIKSFGFIIWTYLFTKVYTENIRTRMRF